MIPTFYTERPCYGEAYSDPKERAKHEGHRSGADCYALTWDEVPMPWVQRQVRGGPTRLDGSRPWMRTWHLAIGIRKDTGHVQVDCNVGSGPGPFRWREVPVLDWRQEPGQWFCRRCVAEWTRGVYSVTVRSEYIRITKGQIEELLKVVEGTALKEITLKPTSIEDKPALLAIVSVGDRDETTITYLVAGNGVIRL